MVMRKGFCVYVVVLRSLFQNAGKNGTFDFFLIEVLVKARTSDAARHFAIFIVVLN